jgi:hypothetical protein
VEEEDDDEEPPLTSTTIKEPVQNTSHAVPEPLKTAPATKNVEDHVSTISQPVKSVATESSSTTAHVVINTTVVKTAEEKLAERAAKFGTSNTTAATTAAAAPTVSSGSTEDKLAARAARFHIVKEPATNSAATNKSSVGKQEALNKKQKRAERFGQKSADTNKVSPAAVENVIVADIFLLHVTHILLSVV